MELEVHQDRAKQLPVLGPHTPSYLPGGITAWLSSGTSPGSSGVALTAPARQTPQQHCPLYPGLVCAWGVDARRQRVTYQSPTRPTCRGAFRYGYRCRGQGEAEVSGADGAGRCMFPNRVPAPRGASTGTCSGVSLCPLSPPSTSSTFRKALFSRAFMITGGMAGAEGKKMSSQCSQPPASHGTLSHTARDQLQPLHMGGGGDTHPWPGLPCRCGTPPPGKWPSGLRLWTRPGGSHSHP